MSGQLHNIQKRFCIKSSRAKEFFEKYAPVLSLNKYENLQDFKKNCLEQKFFVSAKYNQ